MNDILKRPIEVNDIVAWPISNFTQVKLTKGKVVEVNDDCIYVSNISRTDTSTRVPKETSVIVISQQISHNYQEYPENYL